jgi:hypothetical protein
MAGGLQPGRLPVHAVGENLYGEHFASRRVRISSYPCYLAGDAGVHGCGDILVRVADLLAHQHLVVKIDEGLAGSADVLLEGDHHGVRVRAGEDLHLSGDFVGRRVHSSFHEECSFLVLEPPHGRHPPVRELKHVDIRLYSNIARC